MIIPLRFILNKPCRWSEEAQSAIRYSKTANHKRYGSMGHMFKLDM